MILERIREVYDNCMGVHYNTAGVTSSAFQRVARKIGVQAAATDLIFVKICADATKKRIIKQRQCFIYER